MDHWPRDYSAGLRHFWLNLALPFHPPQEPPPPLAGVFLSQAIVTLVMASVTAQTPLTGDRRGHVEWVNCLVPKAREDGLQQVFFDARRWLSVLFNTKDTRLYGDFLGSRKWSKDRLQFPRMAFIFVRRGHGEFIHTRRSRESDPMAGRTPSPARAIVGDTVLCK